MTVCNRRKNHLIEHGVGHLEDGALELVLGRRVDGQLGHGLVEGVGELLRRVDQLGVILVEHLLLVAALVAQLAFRLRPQTKKNPAFTNCWTSTNVAQCELGLIHNRAHSILKRNLKYPENISVTNYYLRI